MANTGFLRGAVFPGGLWLWYYMPLWAALWRSVGGCGAFCGRFAAVGVVLYRVRACGGSVGVVERWSDGHKKSPGSYAGVKEKPPGVGGSVLFVLF